MRKWFWSELKYVPRYTSNYSHFVIWWRTYYFVIMLSNKANVILFRMWKVVHNMSAKRITITRCENPYRIANLSAWVGDPKPCYLFWHDSYALEDKLCLCMYYLYTFAIRRNGYTRCIKNGMCTILWDN